MVKGIFVKRLMFVVLAFSWCCGLGSPFVKAQDAPSPGAMATPGSAEAFLDQQTGLLRNDIRSIKRKAIETNLTLTDSEAARFWPVYEQYQEKYSRIGQTRIAIIKEFSNEYGTMTDKQADRLVRRWLRTDIQAAKLRQKYVPIVRKVLPGTKAATFFQLDRRINEMIDVQLTSQLPLIESQN